MGPAAVHAARAVATWTARAAATAMIAAGAYLVLKKVVFALGVGDLSMIRGVYEGVGQGHDTYRGLGFLIVGGALAVVSRPLAAWIVATPPAGCPNCGYELPAPAPEKCPECGYRLGPSA